LLFYGRPKIRCVKPKFCCIYESCVGETNSLHVAEFHTNPGTGNPPFSNVNIRPKLHEMILPVDPTAYTPPPPPFARSWNERSKISILISRMKTPIISISIYPTPKLYTIMCVGVQAWWAKWSPSKEFNPIFSDSQRLIVQLFICFYCVSYKVYRK